MLPLAFLAPCNRNLCNLLKQACRKKDLRLSPIYQDKIYLIGVEGREGERPKLCNSDGEVIVQKEECYSGLSLKSFSDNNNIIYLNS